MVKTQSLYLTWAWIGTGSWRTDGQTDSIPIANTRSQQYLPVQLLRVEKRKDVEKQQLVWTLPTAGVAPVCQLWSTVSKIMGRLWGDGCIICWHWANTCF